MFMGEHMKQPFITINPAKQIPAMQEIDERTGQTLTLSESHAILRYLVRSRGLADHWYPQEDLRQRAKVDQYLDEHHNFLRQGVGAYCFKKLFAPSITGQTYKDEELDFHVDLLGRALTLLEARLMQHRYLCGDKVSIADLSAACELDSSRFIDLDLARWPQTKAWLHHMIDENPIMLELHKPIRGYAKEFIDAQKADGIKVTPTIKPGL